MTSPQYPQQPQYQPQHQGVSQPQPAAQQAYGQQIAHSGYSYGGYTSTTLVPADVGKRIIAAIVDAIIVAALVAVVIIVIIALSLVPVLGQLVAMVIALLVFRLFFLYRPYFEVTKNGQTIGKRMVGIKVVKDDGTPVDWRAAFLRRWVLAVLGIIELIVVLVRSDRRRLGDMVAHTMVVDASAGALPRYARQLPAQAAPYAPSPQPQQPQPPTPPAGPPQAPAYPQPAPPQAPAPQPPQPQAPPPAPPQAPPPPAT